MADEWRPQLRFRALQLKRHHERGRSPSLKDPIRRFHASPAGGYPDVQADPDRRRRPFDPRARRHHRRCPWLRLWLWLWLWLRLSQPLLRQLRLAVELLHRVPSCDDQGVGRLFLRIRLQDHLSRLQRLLLVEACRPSPTHARADRGPLPYPPRWRPFLLAQPPSCNASPPRKTASAASA